jgi:hypothetical protein
MRLESLRTTVIEKPAAKSFQMPPPSSASLSLTRLLSFMVTRPSLGSGKML